MAAAAPLKSSKPAPKKTAKPAPKIPITSIKAVPGLTAVPLTAGPVIKLAPRASGTPQTDLPEPALKLIKSPGAGSLLPGHIRATLESSLEVPLDPVRVHADGRTAAVVDGLGARAFTYGLNIFLGSREQPTDLELMAHEVAHVVQQQGRPVLQMFQGATIGDAFEQEAHQSTAAAQSGEHITIKNRTEGPRLQGIWPIDEAAAWVENKAWGLLREHAPELMPIIQQGPLEWLKEKITSAFESLFNNLMAPVRAITGVGRWLSGHFAPLLTWIQDAAAKIVRNDCSPFREAADKIEKIAESIITPIVEKLRAVAQKVGDFFKGVWEKIGAPVWDWIKKFAGWHWEQIKSLASWIWDKTAPVRRVLSRAWTWLKNKLGIGEGPEGQNGILQWVQRKAEAAWDWIKVRIEPYKKQLMIVAGVIGGITLLLSPAGPVLVVGGIIVGVVQGVRWIKTNWGKGDGVVRARTYLEKTLIPSLLGGLNKATAAVTRMATSINGALGGFTAGMGRLVNAAAASLLRFVVSAVQWIADQVTEMAQWGSEKLAALSKWVTTTFAKLQQRLQPVLDFLGKVGEVVVDIMKLPMLVVGELWKMIPLCLRAIFVDFLVNQILKRIPIVRDVIDLLPGIWTKLKATGLMLIRKVFKDGDLMAAAFEIFKLILAALQIPPELVTGIISKAATARDMILRDPLGFLGSMLRAIKQGFIQFGEKIWEHLKESIVNWLRGVIESAGLKPPADFSLSSVLEFILQVLGLSVGKILERLEKKIGKEATDKIRKVLSTIAKVWDWISTALNEGPQGVWNRLKQQLGDLWGALLGGAIGWVTGKVTKIALPRITAALCTAPIGAVVEAIIFLYKAIQTAAQYAKRILELVSSVLDGVIDIARGAIAGAANIVEASFGRALTVVIGFLANYLGLGDLGKKLKEIVEVIQEKVTTAIDWVIDKAIAVGKTIISAITKAVKGVAQWWKRRVSFKTKEGDEHSIFVEGDPPMEQIVINPRPRTYVGELIAKLKGTDKEKEAIKRQEKVAKILSENAAAKNEAEVKDAETKLKKALKELADILPVPTVLPTPTYKFDKEPAKIGNNIQRPTIATVTNLSALRPRGTIPGSSVEPAGWLYAQKSGLTKYPPGLRRLHLINDRFGGPGSVENLAVAGKNDNESKHRAQVEDVIKKYVGDTPNEAGISAVLDYQVQAKYERDADELEFKKGKEIFTTANLNDFPSAFICTITLKRAPDDTKDIPTGWPSKQNDPPKKTVSLTFDNDWADKLKTASTKKTGTS